MRSMKTTTLLLLLLLAPLVSRAGEPRINPFTAIQDQGSITITDGSSFYRFSKDGTFYSAYVNQLGGRIIKGTWKRSTDRANNSFVVVGQWGWVNGLSSSEDFRTMVLDIRQGIFRDRRPSESSEMGDRIFDCYFLIDELHRVPKPTT